MGKKNREQANKDAGEQVNQETRNRQMIDPQRIQQAMFEREVQRLEEEELRAYEARRAQQILESERRFNQVNARMDRVTAAALAKLEEKIKKALNERAQQNDGTGANNAEIEVEVGRQMETNDQLTDKLAEKDKQQI